MKKFIVSLAFVFTVLAGTAALAVDSPVVTPNQNTPKNPGTSPKTADVSTLAFAGAGVICIGGAVYCAAKSRNA